MKYLLVIILFISGCGLLVKSEKFTYDLNTNAVEQTASIFVWTFAKNINAYTDPNGFINYNSTSKNGKIKINPLLNDYELEISTTYNNSGE